MTGAVALVLSLLLAVAGSAFTATRAQADDGAFWLPSSWVQAAVGTVAAARGYLDGSGGSVVSGDPLTQGVWGPPGSTNALYGYQKLAAVYGGLGVNGRPIFLRHVETACVAGSGYNLCASGGSPEGTAWPSAFSGTATCVDGGVYGVQVVTATGELNGICASRGGFARVAFTQQRSNYLEYRPFVFVVVAEPLTTELTCRDVTSGVEAVVSETSTSGVAPSPVCPAGSVAVRVRVLAGSSVLQDSALSADSLATYAAYLGAAGLGWLWEFWMGGDPCTEGDVDCEGFVENPGTPVPPGGDCKLVDPMMAITLSVSNADCEEGRDGGKIGPPGGGSNGGDTSGMEPWVQVIKVAIDTATTAVRAVRGAVDGVRSAVDRVVGAVTGGIAQVVSTMQSTVDRIIEAIHEVRDGIGTGVQAILDKLQILIDNQGDGGGPGGGGGPGPGDIGDPGGEGSDLAEKFQPWIDSVEGLIGAFNQPDPGCEGPSWRLVFGTAVDVTLQPFKACEDPMKRVAALTKAGLMAVLIVGGALACVRILMAGIGLQTGQRADPES